MLRRKRKQNCLSLLNKRLNNSKTNRLQLEARKAGKLIKKQENQLKSHRFCRLIHILEMRREMDRKIWIVKYEE